MRYQSREVKLLICNPFSQHSGAMHDKFKGPRAIRGEHSTESSFFHIGVFVTLFVWVCGSCVVGNYY